MYKYKSPVTEKDMVPIITRCIFGNLSPSVNTGISTPVCVCVCMSVLVLVLNVVSLNEVSQILESLQ